MFVCVVYCLVWLIYFILVYCVWVCCVVSVLVVLIEFALLVLLVGVVLFLLVGIECFVVVSLFVYMYNSVVCDCWFIVLLCKVCCFSLPVWLRLFSFQRIFDLFNCLFCEFECLWVGIVENGYLLEELDKINCGWGICLVFVLFLFLRFEF